MPGFKQFDTLAERHHRMTQEMLTVDNGKFPGRWTNDQDGFTKYYCPTCLSQKIWKIKLKLSPQTGKVIGFGGYQCNECAESFTKNQAQLIMNTSIKMADVLDRAYKEGYEAGMNDSMAVTEEDFINQYLEEFNSGIMD